MASIRKTNDDSLKNSETLISKSDWVVLICTKGWRGNVLRNWTCFK